jgi:hypothetical protein
MIFLYKQNHSTMSFVTKSNCYDLTVRELKSFCRTNKLKVGGLKREICERIIKHFESEEKKAKHAKIKHKKKKEIIEEDDKIIIEKFSIEFKYAKFFYRYIRISDRPDFMEKNYHLLGIYGKKFESLSPDDKDKIAVKYIKMIMKGRPNLGKIL